MRDPRLREFDIGPNRAGLTSEEYAAAFPEEYAALLAGEIDAIPGRETRDDVLARFVPALRSYVDTLGDGETGLVVSHGAALRVPCRPSSGGRATPASPSACSPTAAGWCSSTRPRRGPAGSRGGA